MFCQTQTPDKARTAHSQGCQLTSHRKRFGVRSVAECDRREPIVSVRFEAVGRGPDRISDWLPSVRFLAPEFLALTSASRSNLSLPAPASGGEQRFEPILRLSSGRRSEVFRGAARSRANSVASFFPAAARECAREAGNCRPRYPSLIDLPATLF